MQELDRQDVVRLTEALEKFGRWTNKLDKGTNNNSLSLSFGGIGLGISLALVAILLVICFFQVRDISDLQRKYDRMQDYLNAIYAQAPQLKPTGAIK